MDELALRREKKTSLSSECIKRAPGGVCVHVRRVKNNFFKAKKSLANGPAWYMANSTSGDPDDSIRKSEYVFSHSREFVSALRRRGPF